MKKKIISVIMATIMAATPVSAADFSDGAAFMDILPGEEQAGEGVEEPTEEQFFDGKVSSSSEETILDDTAKPVVESRNAPAAKAQDMYQISVSGKVYLSETQKFVDLLNAERKKLGLQPVVLDQEMMEIATRRAIEGYTVYEHVFPDGTSSPYFECGSTLWGNTAEEHFENWKNSPRHWAALTKPGKIRFGMVIFGTDGHYSAYTAAANRRNADYYQEEDENGNIIWIEDAMDDEDFLIPYTGGFSDYTVKGYKINILPKYISNYSSPSTYRINAGKTQILQAYFKTYNTNNKGYYVDNTCGTWTSLNPDIASVDANGLVIAKKSGETKIRFYVNGDKDKYYEATVSVNKTTSSDNKPNNDNTNKEPDKESGSNETPDNDNTPDPDNIEVIYNKNTEVTISGKTVTVTWGGDSKHADGYVVYAAVNGGNSKKVKTITGGNNTSFTTKYPFGSKLDFEIKAYKKYNGKTYYGNSRVCLNDYYVKPAKPAMQSIVDKQSKTLTVRWKKVKDADGYVIYRRTGKTGKYKKIKTIKSGNTVSYKNTNLKKGTTYYYKVRAYGKDSSGKTVYSSWSNVVGKKCK